MKMIQGGEETEVQLGNTHELVEETERDVKEEN